MTSAVRARSDSPGSSPLQANRAAPSARFHARELPSAYASYATAAVFYSGRSLAAVERDELIQAAERALLEAEQAYRVDPSAVNQRRIQRAWTYVREARGEPDDDVPFPFLSSHPKEH